MTTVEKPNYKVIGTRPIRPDGVEKVTGKALYGADIDLPGLVYGKVLRSPHSHARIVSIDTAEAEALPGVLAVMTHADLPIAIAGESDDAAANVLANEKALYRGHAIAAIAATNLHDAEAALAKIKVDYEVLAPVLEVRDAMSDGSPILDESRRTKTLAGSSEKPTNIASHNKLEGGDIVAAFADADMTVEREFVTRMVHQGYIEPHNGTANWNADGTLTVWTSTQGAFAVRSQLASLLRTSVSKIRVIPMEIGGGFGGKIGVYLEPLAAVLSRRIGRPVKLTMERAAVFEATGPTSGGWIKAKLGTKDGKITAAEVTMAYEAGAFPGSPVMAGAMCMLSPYEVENFSIDAYDVVVNKPKVAAYRAPGAPAAAFAIEQLVDELASQGAVDPLKFRRENSAREGSKQVTGVTVPRIGHEETLDAALASEHYNAPIEGPNRGRGVASGFWFNAGMQSSVIASVNPDGTINLIEGSTDIGGSRASLAMQLAETLGITYDEVRPIVVDTDSIGHNDVTGGSRTTHASGEAVYKAGLDIQQQMITRAASLWACDESDINYVDGAIVHVSDDDKNLTFAEMASKQMETGGPMQGKGTVMSRTPGAAFGVHIVDVEVDPDTGKIDILRYSVAEDVGTAIHPSYVEGQLQGGAVQGIGWALNEEYYYGEDGRMENSSFLDYRMPTALDVPMIETILVEVPNPGHPYGVRGVGECPIVPPLAAIANAVHDATGHRFTELPMSPRRVLEELHDIR
jgi:xanthine dehydrogenase molybdenum-binding subunit